MSTEKNSKPKSTEQSVTFLQLSSKERRFVRLIRRFIYLTTEKQKPEKRNLNEETLKKIVQQFFSQEKYKSIDKATQAMLTDIALYDQYPPSNNKAKHFHYEGLQSYPPVESTAKIFSYFLEKLDTEQKLLFIDSCDILSGELADKLKETFVNATFLVDFSDAQLQEAIGVEDLLNLAKLVAYNDNDFAMKSKIMKNLSKRNLNRFLKDLQYAQNFSQYEKFVGAVEISAKLYSYKEAYM